MSNEDRQPTEDELQVYSADVFRAFGVPGVVGWHTPNGMRVRPAVAKKMKAFGVLSGVADWTFIVPGRAAFVELKTLTGRQRPEQKKFQRNVEALGCVYVIARTPEEIDGAFAGLGVINKPNAVPCRGSDAMGRTAGEPVSRIPCRSTLKRAA